MLTLGSFWVSGSYRHMSRHSAASFSSRFVGLLWDLETEASRIFGKISSFLLFKVTWAERKKWSGSERRGDRGGKIERRENNRGCKERVKQGRKEERGKGREKSCQDKEKLEWKAGRENEWGERESGTKPACRWETHARLMGHVCPLAPCRMADVCLPMWRLMGPSWVTSGACGQCVQWSLGPTWTLVGIHLQNVG